MCGFVSQGVPPEVTCAETFEELRENLVLYAQMREEAEAKGRTHYRTLLSFEHPLTGTEAVKLVSEWLKAAFPDNAQVTTIYLVKMHMGNQNLQGFTDANASLI